jgi:hypothetical protein
VRLRHRTAGGVVHLDLYDVDGNHGARATRYLGSYHPFFLGRPSEKMSIDFQPPGGRYDTVRVVHLARGRHRRRPTRIVRQAEHHFGACVVAGGDTLTITIEIGTP